MMSSRYVDVHVSLLEPNLETCGFPLEAQISELRGGMTLYDQVRALKSHSCDLERADLCVA